MSTQYIHFTKEQKQIARQTDIAELLRSQGEVLKRSGSEYEWRDGSQKVTVRGNLWYHQYEQVGGDAIDFVRRYGKAIAKAKTGTKDGFVYGNIEGGIVLKANTTYYIVSDYWGETDKFYSASQQVTTDVATLDGIVILNASNEYDFYEATGTGWGPLTFRYAMEIPVTGDNSNWLIAVVVMLLSAIAVVILRFCGQKVFVR